MSPSGIAAAAPVVAPAPPAEVRAAGADAVKAYQSAQGFERLLVERLATTMTQNTELGSGASAGMVSQALADGIVAGGGLGLADGLYRSMTLGDAATAKPDPTQKETPA